MTIQDDDFSPVTGGVDLHPSYVRTDLFSARDLTATSDLDIHLIRLLTLHPGIQVAFRSQDLAILDDATKMDLLGDINDLLGIKPLTK